MNSSLSLQNKTVLVPRREKDAKVFSDIVKKNGGIPIEIPLLAFRSVKDPNILSALTKINIYDWIIFTSQTTVDTFFDNYTGSKKTFPKIAAIGEKTAQLIRQKGFKVDFIPTQYVAENFIIDFSVHIKEGMKIFLPKGNLARDYISLHLRGLGATVDDHIVYETYLPEESKETLKKFLNEERLDIIPFTSPSTVDHFMEVVEVNQMWDKIKTCLFACIGPVSKKRADAWGLSVQAVPKVFTVEEMFKEILAYLSRQKWRTDK